MHFDGLYAREVPSHCPVSPVGGLAPPLPLTEQGGLRQTWQWKKVESTDAAPRILCLAVGSRSLSVT